MSSRTGANTPRTEHRLVRGVLVEVDEYALASVLPPPLGSQDVIAASLKLSCNGDGCRPNLVGVPSGLEPDVHV